jgi:parallel beta-helix repeat protein
MLVAAPPAQAATTLYVDQHNSRCSNTGAGTQTIPFCTIGAAAKAATAGATVQVASGTYVENVTPPNSGTSDAPITFMPAPGADVTVTGQIHAFTVNAQKWITITGFNVTGTTQYGIYLKGGASHVTLSGNHVTYSGQPVSGSVAQGIYLVNTTDSLVVGNTTDHNSDTGIYLTTGDSGIEIRGNTSFANARVYTRAATGIDVRSPGNTVVGNVTYGNEDSGIQLYNGANGTVVKDNLSYNNGDHGIDVLNSTDTVIVANTVYHNVTAGINFEGKSGTTASSGGTVRNNISLDNGLNSPTTKGNIRVDVNSLTGTTLDYDLVNLSQSGTMMTWGTKSYSTLGAFTTSSGQEDHGLQADPKWVGASAGDFHLRGGSPAVDSADSSAPSQPAVDIEGNARVDDPATPDIGVGPRTYDDRGAYEYQPDNPPVASLSLSPSSGVAPLLVNADASASTDTDATPVSTYTFDFGDGTSQVGPQPSATATHTYSSPGSYNVVVTVTDTGGRSSTKAATVTVTSADNPPTAALTVNPSSGTAPLDVTADASGSTDPDATPVSTYTFDFGDGTAAVGPQASPTADHTYTSVGTYTTTVTVTDTGGAEATATATVTVGAATIDEVHYSFVSPTSVAFDWRGGPDTIRYGTTASYGQSVQGATPSPLPYSSAGPFWEAQLTGLAPGTTYHYSIGGGPDSTFTTEPNGNFRFDVEADVGDSATYPNMGVIQSQIAADSPSAVIVAGDLTYGEAHGQQAVDQHFNDVMGWSSAAAYMPAWGNHDWETTNDDLRNYKGRFLIPNQHASPGAPSLGCCGEDWGWFDAGGVRFISYPEPYSGTTWSDWASQADSIMAAAQADPGVEYIVTFGHRPAYSTGAHPGSAALASILDGLGDKYPKYVLNLNGHSHDYERFSPIHGVVHITTGGGGATLETPWTSTDPRTAYRAMHLGYLRVDVTASALSVQAICGPASPSDDIACTQGSVIDSVTIPAPGADQPPAAALTVTPPAGTTPLQVTADASASTDNDATPISSYAFDFGDGSPVAGPQAAATATHTYTSVGTYTVKVTVTDTDGRPSVTTSQVVVSAPPADNPPVAALTVTPSSGTAPLTVSADASASTDTDLTPISTYRFAWGDGSSTSAQTSPAATHQYVVAGTYTVTMTVTDTAGQSSTATAQVKVNPLDNPPAATLSVSPTSGNAPLNVTADASASTDADSTPIASYRFDFGDGVVVGPQAGSGATHTYSAAGSYTVTVRVTDTAGQSTTATVTVNVSPPAGTNLVGNPGFETDSTGWNNNGHTGITLTRVSGGNSGSWAAAMTNTTTAAQSDCTLNDSPNWVKATQSGTYQAGLWVRADTAGAVLKLRLREYNGSTFVSSATAQITLSTSWQHITVNYVPQVPGSALDFTAYTSNAAPGNCFYADDASIMIP